ncbi:MAG: glycine cleavage system protein GcvH [Deltaproteobacteria bacterium]|uniref:glycine cleavage system protein GcvH n=1 Tax=Desulfosarcina sp. BuS5 TaxID=933262 RepID=UPI00048542E4|nr:glycine cleavage system protein GcvH [Desulfosarcina sp. BuS5]MCD6273459.1 glycine cleavage system protein GcvH [Deltaproteobacteria bacterium]WDN87190.1 glycine cleavage system H protein [Desulfosarcina sp. BuS5]
MKDIDELNIPDHIKYGDTHEWAELKGDMVKIGISDYAQDQLGDIVFVELPEVGTSFSRGDEFGTVESVKAVSELYMPVGGEVSAVNAALGDAPELVNNDPYNAGWMIEIKLINKEELTDLMDKTAYLKMLKG